MGEKLKHFSHKEHPLILIQIRKKDNDDDDHKEVCYGCQKQILEPEEAYSCLPCHFFLHKRCAMLPFNILHPLHSQHPLILLKEPPTHYTLCVCDACRQPWKYFTYHCYNCKFDLDVTCAMMEFEEIITDRKFEHECHEHPLIFQQRPASFICDACHVEGKDSLYICTICPFWIHRRCLSQTVKHKHHDHSLRLAYCIPEDYRKFDQECAVCHCKILQNIWVYYCGPCRYFVHVKCVKIINGNDPIIDGESEEQEDVAGPSASPRQSSNVEVLAAIDTLQATFMDAMRSLRLDMMTQFDHLGRRVSTIEDYMRMHAGDQSGAADGDDGDHGPSA